MISIHVIFQWGRNRRVRPRHPGRCAAAGARPAPGGRAQQQMKSPCTRLTPDKAKRAVLRSLGPRANKGGDNERISCYRIANIQIQRGSPGSGLLSYYLVSCKWVPARCKSTRLHRDGFGAEAAARRTGAARPRGNRRRAPLQVLVRVRVRLSGRLRVGLGPRVRLT